MYTCIHLYTANVRLSLGLRVRFGMLFASRAAPVGGIDSCVCSDLLEVGYSNPLKPFCLTLLSVCLATMVPLVARRKIYTIRTLTCSSPTLKSLRCSITNAHKKLARDEIGVN